MAKIKQYEVYYEVEMKVFVEATSEDEAIDKARLIPEDKWQKFEGEMFEVYEVPEGE
jgi:hypothetical protein